MLILAVNPSIVMVSNSHYYITERFQSCDILCLSETWLRPQDLSVIYDSMINTYPDLVYFAKSAMKDLDSDYHGRPFGGTAILCHSKDNLSFHELDISNDRILPIGIHDMSGAVVPIIIIVCVYFPFYDPQNMDTYLSTIDALQAILDNYGSLAPIKICGDFNTPLPKVLL